MLFCSPLSCLTTSLQLAPGAIRKLSGGTVSTLATGLGALKEITAHPDGNFYFTGSSNTIRRISPQGDSCLFRSGESFVLFVCRRGQHLCRHRHCWQCRRRPWLGHIP